MLFQRYSTVFEKRIRPYIYVVLIAFIYISTVTRKQSKRQVQAEYLECSIDSSSSNWKQRTFISFDCIRWYIGSSVEGLLHRFFRQAMKERQEEGVRRHATCISARDHAYNTAWNVLRGFTPFTWIAKELTGKKNLSGFVDWVWVFDSRLLEDGARSF